MGSDPGTDVFLADELDYLRACLGAMAVTPEAFDMTVLAPRLGRAVEALEKVLELAGKAGVRLSACGVTGRCSCGEHPVAWNLDPAKVREAITAALAGASQ